MNIVEKITKVIINNGGIAEDISFATEEMIEQLGERLAASGFYSRHKNNHVFNISPVNTYKEVFRGFKSVYSWISSETCPIKEVLDEEKTIELIQLTPEQSTEENLREIDELGFESVSVNYLLGLGVKHRVGLFGIYEKITTLDKSNFFLGKTKKSTFLILSRESRFQLTVAEEVKKWNYGWWFAVVRKKT